MSNYRALFLVFWVAVSAIPASHCLAQSKFEAPPELKASYDLINVRSVEAAVSFLASDAMRGRQTPSRELDIASAYVAARFKAAGLEGLGDKGSFMQTTEIATSAVPNSGIEFSVDGKPIAHYGLLGCAAEEFEHDGPITVATGEEGNEVRFDGVLTIVAPDFAGPRDRSNFMRRLARYGRAGASAILVQVAEDHPLVGAAKQAIEPRVIQTRGLALGHVLLIPKMDLTAGKLDLPKQVNGKTSVSNVIGVIKGSDPELSKQAIIVTAHLDHIGVTGLKSGDTINNGADDNATGSTAIVTLADAFGAMKTPPKRSVIFMTFWGEEKGFLGSYHYVRNPTWPLEDTVCNVNIEMIGRPEAGANEKVWVTGWDRSDLGKLMNVGSQKAGVLIFSHPQFSGDMLFRASDNYPFFEKGIVAHSFSAGSLHSDYHQVSDHIEKLELKHMTRVIQGMFSGVLHLANGATPKMSEKNR